MNRWAWMLVGPLALAGGCGGGSGEPAEDENAHAAASTSGDEGHGDEGHGDEGHAEASHHGAGGEDGEPEGPPEPTRVLDDGSQLYGAELDEGRSVTELSQILAEPSSYEGQVVKTEGEIAQVCQRMGCWMEIRTDADSPGVRVPMAGHAFFLPRDVAGRRTTIEGTVIVASLSAEEQEHLESEGATAADQDVSIEATGVVVHP